MKKNLSWCSARRVESSLRTGCFLALLGGLSACAGSDSSVVGTGGVTTQPGLGDASVSGSAAQSDGAAQSGGTTTRPGLGGAPVSGGATQSGGAWTRGGATQSGGAPTSAGGRSSGGVQTGGALSISGGAGRGSTTGAKGGAASGGTSIGSGGKATGGVASGGEAKGGQSASGGKGTGGAATGPCVASAGTSGGHFELLFEDQFNSIDSSRWGLMTHTWDGNLAQFTAANASTNGGILTLALTSAAADPAKPFRGVEMRSVDALTYGRVEGSIRFAAGSGVVSALVTIYTPWPPDDWNELDVEFLGKSTNQIQFNHMINIPPADPNTGHLQYPKLVTLPFNATADFHTYVIEWVPGRARFIVDGTILHEATQEMSRMTRPQNVLLTIWASNSVAWAGPIDSTTPTTMQVEWIRLCRYVQ